MNQHSRNTMNSAVAVLWASAFVIAAMIIVQAGQLPGNAAHAGMVADRGSYTLLTGSSGRGGETQPDDVLYVIDSREQFLLVYEIDDYRKKQIPMRVGYELEGLFQRAKQ